MPDFLPPCEAAPRSECRISGCTAGSCFSDTLSGRSLSAPLWRFLPPALPSAVFPEPESPVSSVLSQSRGIVPFHLPRKLSGIPYRNCPAFFRFPGRSRKGFPILFRDPSSCSSGTEPVKAGSYPAAPHQFPVTAAFLQLSAYFFRFLLLLFHFPDVRLQMEDRVLLKLCPLFLQGLVFRFHFSAVSFPNPHSICAVWYSYALLASSADVSFRSASSCKLVFQDLFLQLCLIFCFSQ